eukprot:GHRR01009931.1.p1 GENE.GHRR01009931.1~~GHRR01009931.1.p1  ORF type:complete len:139 (+),score=51.33 GHRR01009931.1:177-593(+)
MRCAAGTISQAFANRPRPLLLHGIIVPVHAQETVRLRCNAAVDMTKFASQSSLDKAAQRFRLGLEQGLEEDFLVAVELGASSLEELSEAQLEYIDKIKEKLLKRAVELQAEEAERRKQEAAYLEAGKLVCIRCSSSFR